ncbi:MAG TPA: adenylyl-sulfate kinase [Thermoanaerobaculia bacterium]
MNDRRDDRSEKTQAAARNLTYQHGSVGRVEREVVAGQRGCVLWLTGLSGSGKSTIAHATEKRLIRERRLCYVLDGDNIRHGLNADLGFSPEERSENIRRIGEVAALFADAGLIAIVAFIAPTRAGRDQARSRAGRERFFEIFIDAPIAVCEARDPKGLYQKARAGEIAEFTGVSAPYEEPENPELRIRSDGTSIDDAVERIHELLVQRSIIDPRPEVATS